MKRINSTRFSFILLCLVAIVAMIGFGIFLYAKKPGEAETSSNTSFAEGELNRAASKRLEGKSDKNNAGHIGATIPFRLTEHNNILVDATLNDVHSLSLMFHTAVEEVSLVQSTIEKLPEFKFDGEIESSSWGGNAQTGFANGHSLSLGPVRLDKLTIFQSQQSGHYSDGKFGPAQLKSPCLEIDFDRLLLELHPSVPHKVLDWDHLPITTRNNMMFIEGQLSVDDKIIPQTFMIHSGYSGFALLDDQFVSQHPSISNLEIIEESELTDSNGNKIKTMKSRLPHFSIGSTKLEDVPVSFFSGAIGRQKISVLGGEFLKHFNVVFDFKANTLYLKKRGDESTKE